MSLLSLKDFATSCNVKYGTLKAHINRNKVVKQSDNWWCHKKYEVVYL